MIADETNNISASSVSAALNNRRETRHSF